MRVKIVGRWENGKQATCDTCRELNKYLRESLDELGLKDVLIEECTGEEEYRSYGVIPTPLLIINDKIKTSGRAVPKAMLKELLRQEIEKEIPVVKE